MTRTQTGVLRIVLFSITALLFGLAGPTRGAVATVTLQSQGWWSKTGIVLPSQTGQHIHLQATVPVDGVPIDGKVAVPVSVALHAQTGATSYLRVSDGSTVKQSWPLKLGPCPDCSWSGTVTVDFSTWGTGRREMRWTANVPSNDQGKRQFQSTGWQVCVRSCSPSYRSGPYTALYEASK